MQMCVVTKTKQLKFCLFCRSPQPISRRLKSKSIKPELRDLLIAQGKSPDEAEVGDLFQFFFLVLQES